MKPSLTVASRLQAVVAAIMLYATLGMAIAAPQVCPRVEATAPVSHQIVCPGKSVFYWGKCWSCPSDRPYTAGGSQPKLVELDFVMDDKGATMSQRPYMVCQLDIAEDVPATMVRQASCGSGSFFDPRNGGECWSCPGGYNRNLEPVTHERACEKAPIVGPFARATFRNATGPVACDGGSFFDPRNGGECWKCPAGFDRSLSPVTAGDACTRYWNGKRIAGTVKFHNTRVSRFDYAIGVPAPQCPPGQAGGGVSDQCLECPAGTVYGLNNRAECSKTVAPPPFNAGAFKTTAERTAYCKEARGCKLASYATDNDCLAALWPDEKARLEQERARLEQERLNQLAVDRCANVCVGTKAPMCLSTTRVQCVKDALAELQAAQQQSGTAANWTNLVGAAVDVGAGGGALWVVGTNPVPGGFGLHRWDGKTFVPVSGGAVRIDADAQGNAWVVNDKDDIFRWTGSGWTQLPGKGKDIGVGANGTVWLIGANKVPGGYGIYRWTGTNWENMPGGAVRIDVDPKGNAWAVNDANSIFRWTGSGWEGLPGKARDIGIGPDGSVFTVGDNGTLFKWNGTAWIMRDVPKNGLSEISVGPNGVPVGVNASKQIWLGYP